MLFVSFIAPAFSQTDAPLDEPVAKSEVQSFDSVVNNYLAQKDFEGLLNYLGGLLDSESFDKAKVYYYLALGRYKQIIDWKETKDWEAVYDKAPAYKSDMLENLEKAQQSPNQDIGLLLSIKYLKWQILQEDYPDAAVGAFNDLANTAQGSSDVSKDVMQKIKEIADELSEMKDKSYSRRIYEIYVAKLKNSELSLEEMFSLADKYLSESNIYLAKALYEAYIKGLDGSQGYAQKLVLVADKFADNGWKEGIDPFYAEDLYKKATEIASVEAFDAYSQYLRALNLERMRNYKQAFQEYKKFLDSYSQDSKRAEVCFRMAVLAAYEQQNISLADEYFTKVKDESPEAGIYISSLYEQALLKQYKEKFSEASKLYNQCIATAKKAGLDLEKDRTALLAKERLEEIQDKKDFKYPLKLFFQEIFKERLPGIFQGLDVDLTAKPAKQHNDKQINFIVTTSNTQTGCMMPSFSYIWSGQLGELDNIPNSAELSTEYDFTGTKVVHVVIVGPSGPQGAGVEIVAIESNSDNKE